MNLIYLDISGKLFLTSPENFTTYPNTLLGRMFSKENRELLKSDYVLNNREAYYFDRDPKIFSHILNFYRNSMTYIPKKTNKHIFWKELMYWGFEYEGDTSQAWPRQNFTELADQPVSLPLEPYRLNSLQCALMPGAQAS